MLLALPLLLALSAHAQAPPTPREARIERDDLRSLLDLDRATALAARRRRGGLELRELTPGLVAMGLERGDVPLAVDGRPLRGPKALELLLTRLMTEPRVPVSVQRGERRVDLDVAISGPPLAVPPWWGLVPDAEDWRAARGIALTELHFSAPRRSLLVRERDDGTRLPALGVWTFAAGTEPGFILRMREHSVGTSLGLAAGDRVLRVDGEPVVDGADVVDLHQRLASASRVALDIATPTGERRLVWSLTGRPLDLVLTTDDVRFAVRDEEAVAAVATLPEGVAPAAILDAVGEAPPPRLEPHVDLLGHPDGVRVMGLRPRAPLFALGLRNGDVIHAIAGAPVGEQDAGAALIAALSSGREFELRLSRGGDEPLTLRLTGSASRPPAPSP